ncbi:hypothetical protein T02_6804, partial [Trichinella nativa]
LKSENKNKNNKIIKGTEMKQFDPTSSKWQVCCCHVTSAAYTIALVELLVAAVISTVLIPMSVNEITFHSTRILYAIAAGVALIWSFGQLVLIYDIRRRHLDRLSLYVFVQGIVFILMLFLIISIFLARQLRHKSNNDEEDIYSESMFSIVMAFFFAAGAMGITIYSIYVLLLLKRYMTAEKKHSEVMMQIQDIVHHQSLPEVNTTDGP